MPWRPPRPRLELVAYCDATALPAMADVVGRGGVDGSALEADEETMTGLDVAMAPGEAYWVTSPAGDLFRIEVDERSVVVRLDSLAGSARGAFEYAAAVTRRICELAGATADLEPVAVASVPDRDGLWIRTRGLERFARPELEVYGVPAPRREAAEAALRRIAGHLADGGSIEPGRKLGFGDAHLIAREGERNRDAWGDTVVLELVDLDVTGHSHESGRGLGGA